MAIMSEFVYSAMSAKSLTSAGGLADPFHRDLTLDRDFLALPQLGGLITDQHLQERDRMGRTVAFLARLVAGRLDDGGPGHRRRPRDRPSRRSRATARSEVFATPTHTTPYVYFLQTPGPPEVCAPGDAADLPQRRGLSHRARRHVRSRRWTGTGGIAYTLSAEAGVLTSSRGEIY